MQKASLILYSTAIFTGIEDHTITGAVAIKGQKILMIGTKEESEKYRDTDTKVIDCKDQLLLPGFCDAHAHFMEGALLSSPHFCSTLGEAKSEEECVQMMVEFAKQYPDLPRYFGYGWLPAYWGGEMRFPTKESLDQYFPDKPVYLRAVDGHSEWLNTKALEESGYTKVFIPEYGHVDYLPNGELSGLLREQAACLARQYDCRLPEEEMISLQKKLVKSMNAKGITSCTEMGAVLPEHIDEEYQYVKALEESGEMTLRLFLYPGTDIDANRIKEIAPYKEKYKSDILKIAGLKGFADGVTSTYTAALLKPYFDKPDDCGLLNHPENMYHKWTVEANKQGYGVRVHCIGDKAVQMMLDAYEESNQVNNNSSIRNSIEHIEVIDPADIGRFKQLNVVPSMQPLHLPLDRFDKIYRVGKERSRYEWALRSIVDTGATLAAGTDYPIADYDPIPNIYNAVTRKGLDGVQYGLESLKENLTIAQILKAYTYGGAYVNHMEDKVGTLEAGKYADVVVLNQDLFKIDPEEIINTKVCMTIMNGQIVYKL